MRRVRAAIAAAPLAVPAGDALAGAWTQAPGAGQVIATFGRDVGALGGRAADTSADAGPASFTQLYVEYGVLEGLTLGGAAFVKLSDQASMREEGEASLAGFARQRLWQSGDGAHVVSAQAGHAHPIGEMVAPGLGEDNPDAVPETRLRALYGHGFGTTWGNGFVSLESGYDRRWEGAGDELRLDATAGFAPDPCCLAMMSVYSTYALDREEDDALTLAPSFAYRFGGGEEDGGRTTIQLGASYDLLATDEEAGVQVSIWRSF